MITRRKGSGPRKGSVPIPPYSPLPLQHMKHCRECGRATWDMDSDVAFGMKIGGLIGLGIGLAAAVGLMMSLG